MGSYECERGHQCLETWIIQLAKSVETFVMVSISDIPTINYWQIWKNMDNSKEISLNYA